ncbi:hypothetical protein MTO96_051265 [Rhipicephalus appendiculatus]
MGWGFNALSPCTFFRALLPDCTCGHIITEATPDIRGHRKPEAARALISDCSCGHINTQATPDIRGRRRPAAACTEENNPNCWPGTKASSADGACGQGAM